MRWEIFPHSKLTEGLEVLNSLYSLSCRGGGVVSWTALSALDR